MKNIVLLFILLLLPSLSFAQERISSPPKERIQSPKLNKEKSLAVLVTIPNGDVTSLIENVLFPGNCATVSNLVFTGNADQIGDFFLGSSSISIESGMIMSTGSILDAPGPNSASGTGTTYGTSTADADIDAIAGGGTISDYTSVEFDFVPTMNGIDLTFVFASEEYCEFSNSATYNDVFGFFVSGPGILGPYSNNSINIAELPTGQSICNNNVNETVNTGFFIDNIVGSACGSGVPYAPNDLEFDGFTTVLNATASLTAGQSYHAKMVIVDRGDGGQDSAVFFEGSCCSLTADVGADVTICPGTPFPINAIISNNSGAEIYSWSADPAIGLSYLNNTNIANPIITLPVGVPVNVTYTLTVTDGICLTTDDIIVMSYTPPSPIGGDASFCTGFGTTLDAGSFSSYMWSTTETTSTITVNTTGTYNVTVTDTNGCDGVATFNVTETAAPDATITGNPSFCTGESENLSAPVGYTGYLWSTGEDTEVISVSSAGTYTVTVTDNNGCEGIGMITITENTPPTPAITGNLSICSGESTTLDAGNGYTSYTWTGGGSSQTNNYNSPGTYTVTVTDANNCEGTANVTIIESPPLNPSITGDLSICSGASTTLDAGSSYVSYNWTGGGSSQTNNYNTPGTYSVTVMDANGCEGQTSVTITENLPPTPIITGTLSVCTQGNTSTLLDAGSGFTTYGWSNGSTTQTTTVSSAGTYTVTVTDSEGCEGEQTVMVNEYNVTDPTITGDNTVCPNESTILDAGAGFTIYNWSTGGNTQQITAGGVGTYTLTVTDANGCETNAEYIVSAADVPTPEITGDLNFCENTTAILIATNGYTSYNWTGLGTANGSEYTVSTPGIVTLDVTNAEGCEGSVFVDVVQNANPEVVIAGNASICQGEVEFIDAGPGYVSYLWSNTWDQQVLGINDPGTYSVTVTDGNGCEGEGAIEITEASLLNVIISGNTEICSDGNTVLDVGTGYSDYEWSNGLTSSVIAVFSPGTYSVTVSNSTGCSGEASVEVTELPPLSPVLNGTLSICEGGSSELSLSQIYTTYEWSDGSGGATYEATSAGLVTVTVTDANGCTATTEETISILAPEVINISGIAEICEGGSTELTANESFTSYLWSNGATGQTITINDIGTYNVTGTTAAGCESISDSVTVTIQPTEITISGDTSFCEGSSVLLNVTPGWDTYSWSNGENGEMLEFTEGGIYTVTVTSASGCSAENQIELVTYPTPTVSIIGSATFCPGGATALSSDGTFETYLWSDNSTSQALTASSEDLYGLTVTDSNGCEASDSINVVEQAELSPVISGILEYCEGSSTVLDAGTSYETYAWSTSDDTPISEITSPGTVTIFVTDAFGCSGQASVEITENPNPVLSISGEDYFCEGDSAMIFVNDIYASYLWTDGTNESSTIISSPGIQQLIVSDGNGCEGSANFEVTEQALPTPEISGNLNYCPGEATTLLANAGFVNYEWTGGSQQTSLEVTSSGIYELTVKDNNGCEGTNTVDVQAFTTQNPQITGILDFCPGDTTVLEVSNNFENYLWSTGGLNAQLPVHQAAIYSVIVTDSNGCETTANTETSIFNVNNPVITGLSEFCSGENVQLDAGSGFSTYNWSGTENTQVINLTNGGQYSVTVTDNNTCETSADYQITEHELPEVNIGGSSSYCIGSFTTLNAGNVYASYLWSTGSEESSIDVSSPETFNLVVMDEFGCEGQGSINVTEDTELNPVITGSLEYCETANTTLDAGSGFATYLWSDNSNSPTLAVDVAGMYSVTVTDAGGCIGSAAVEIIENPLPSPQITGAAEFCEGNTTTLDAGSGYANYQWSTGSNNQQLEVSTPGLYTIAVTNAFGCVDSTLITVEQSPLPVFSIEGSTFFCSGSSTILEANGIFETYQWSDGITTTSTVDINTSGVIGLTVGNEYGCTQYEEIAIQEINLPIATAGMDQNLDCEVLTTVIGSFETSTGNEFIYQWAGPGIDMTNENLLQPEVNMEGQYILMVTDTLHNCVSETSAINITDLAYVPDVSLAVNDELDCITNVVTIDATGSHTGSQIIYQWKDGAGNIIADNVEQILEVNQADTYTLEVMDMATGCHNQDSIEVTENINLPLAAAGESGHLDCNVVSYTLDGLASQTGSNITYNWEAIQGEISMGQNTLTPVVTQPGIYLLTVHNEDNGCESSDDVVVTQNIVAPIANAGENQEIDCHNETVIIDASATSTGNNITTNWTHQDNSLSEQGLIFKVSQSGVYGLTVENEENGCNAYSEVEVSINVNIPTDVQADFENPTCFGDSNGSITIAGVTGGSEPFIYSLDGASFSTSANFQGLTGGMYTLTVQDMEGCEYEQALILEDGNDLQLDLGEDIYINLGEEAFVEASINIDAEDLQSIVWQAADSLTCGNGCLSFTAQPIVTSDYTITITDENGCQQTEKLTVFVNRVHEVFMPNAFSPNGDGNNDIFMVFGGQDVQIVRSFLIFNRWGENIFQVYDFPPNDPAYGWDGYELQKLHNTQVFTYFAEVEFIDGEVVLFKGDVVLMK